MSVRACPAQGLDLDLLPSSSQATAPESIPIETPDPGSLLPISDKLPPIRLDAVYNQPADLKEILNYGINNNLAIRIATEEVNSQRWTWRQAAARFLPDILMSYRQEILAGAELVGGIIPFQFHTPNVLVLAGFQGWGFRGGEVLFGALSQRQRLMAARFALQASINDTLLDMTTAYFRLLENQALLRIRVKAVDTAREQLDLNEKLEQAGTATKFEVLQSQTLLAEFEQQLLAQQVALRRSSLKLAKLINTNLTANLLSAEANVQKKRCVHDSLSVHYLLALAAQHRPELKTLEHLRTAARRQIQVAAARLYPRFRFFGTVEGNGATLTRTTTVVPGSVQLVQLAAPPPEGVVLFAPAPSTNPVSAVGTVITPPQVVSRQIRRSYTLGFQIDWNYPSIGMADMSRVESARYLARKATLEYNQMLLKVQEEVRTSYLESHKAEKLIGVASTQVASATEQLRLAEVRRANGFGTNLDVIAAQQVYVEALVRKAQAMIEFNISQAKLLRNVGLISINNLTSGIPVTRG